MSAPVVQPTVEIFRPEWGHFEEVRRNALFVTLALFFWCATIGALTGYSAVTNNNSPMPMWVYMTFVLGMTPVVSFIVGGRLTWQLCTWRQAQIARNHCDLPDDAVAEVT
jgi:hypothetical protein